MDLINEAVAFEQQKKSLSISVLDYEIALPNSYKN